jgi:hypothetical protein
MPFYNWSYHLGMLSIGAPNSRARQCRFLGITAVVAILELKHNPIFKSAILFGIDHLLL